MTAHRVSDGVVIDGRTAVLVGFALRKGLESEHFQNPAAATARRQLTAVLAEVESAAVAWSERVLGKAETRVPAQRPSSMSIREAAPVLGLCERQTRNIALQLGGRHIKGRWRLDTAAVAAEAERRREDRP